MMKILSKLLIVLLATTWMGAASAAKCTAPKPAAEMSIEDLSALYECLRPKLIKGYQKKGKKLAMAYTDWKAASIAPQAPGMHSGQYLMTYVNDIGYDEYVKFATSGAEMPVGTIIAKEAFSIKSSGKTSKGPYCLWKKSV